MTSQDIMFKYNDFLTSFVFTSFSINIGLCLFKPTPSLHYIICNSTVLISLYQETKSIQQLLLINYYSHISTPCWNSIKMSNFSSHFGVNYNRTMLDFYSHDVWQLSTLCAYLWLVCSLFIWWVPLRNSLDLCPRNSCTLQSTLPYPNPLISTPYFVSRHLPTSQIRTQLQNLPVLSTLRLSKRKQRQQI